MAHLLLPSLPLLLTTLIRLTAPSPFLAANPRILQRVYDVLGALFRDLARDILAAESSGDELAQQGDLQAVWEVVRRGLGAPAKPDEVAPEDEDEEEKMDVDEAIAAVADAAADEPSDAEDEDEPAAADEEVAPVASTSAQQLDEPAVKLYTTLPANFRTTPQTRRLLANAFAFLVRKAKPPSSGSTDSAVVDHVVSLDDLFARVIADVAAVEDVDGGERANAGTRGAKGRRKGKGKGRGQEEGSSNVFAEGITWLVLESCSVRLSPC